MMSSRGDGCWKVLLQLRNQSGISGKSKSIAIGLYSFFANGGSTRF